MSKLISINCDGNIETHIAENHTDHVSMCGIDGFEDGEMLNQTILKKTGKKVDCAGCITLWEIATAIPKSMIGEPK